jgi:hypothetical protein
MQKVMSVDGMGLLVTSSNIKLTGLHRMTCVEQRRLIMRIEFVKTKAAPTIHAANTAKAGLDRMTQEVRKLVYVLGYIVFEVDSDGLLEAVPAGLLRELQRVLESIVADVGVKMDVDRRQ